MITSLISCPIDHYLTVEKPVVIDVQEEEEDPINFDTYLGPFTSVDNKTIRFMRVPLDWVVIP